MFLQQPWGCNEIIALRSCAMLRVALCDYTLSMDSLGWKIKNIFHWSLGNLRFSFWLNELVARDEQSVVLSIGRSDIVMAVSKIQMPAATSW